MLDSITMTSSDHHGVSNHRWLHCLFYLLFTTKKTSTSLAPEKRPITRKLFHFVTLSCELVQGWHHSDGLGQQRDEWYWTSMYFYLAITWYQCWLRNRLLLNVSQDTYILIHENQFEIIVCEMSAMLFRLQSTIVVGILMRIRHDGVWMINIEAWWRIYVSVS